MTKFLKKFDTHAEYQTYIEGEDSILPNVSKCVNTDDVHYNPENSVIVYKSPTMLPHTTIGLLSGLHTNCFIPSMKSHSFSNGVGMVKINGKLTALKDYAFKGSKAMTYVSLPEGVTSIGAQSFNGCDNLIGIHLPQTLTTVGNAAFSYCENLISLDIPRNVTSFGKNHASCSGLERITVASGNEAYDSRNNCNAIVETETNTLIFGCKNTIIPVGILKIGERAFDGCNTLTEILIPEGVEEICDSAFAVTNLKDVTLPSTIMTIGKLVFSHIESLNSVTVLATTPPVIGENVFFRYNDMSPIKIFVPAESVEAYKADEGWSVYADQIVPINA